MNRTRLFRWFNRLILGIALLDLLALIFFHAFPFQNMPQAVRVFYGIIGIALVTATYGIWYYRPLFRTWYGWIPLLTLLIGSNLVVHEVIAVTHPSLRMLMLGLFLTCLWSVGPAFVLLIWKRDLGLPSFALGLLALVWSMTLAERNFGSLFSLIAVLVQNPGHLWWLPLWMCLFWWIIPLSMLGFAGHTLRLILGEFKANR